MYISLAKNDICSICYRTKCVFVLLNFLPSFFLFHDFSIFAPFLVLVVVIVFIVFVVVDVVVVVIVVVFASLCPSSRALPHICVSLCRLSERERESGLLSIADKTININGNRQRYKLKTFRCARVAKAHELEIRCNLWHFRK